MPWIPPNRPEVVIRPPAPAMGEWWAAEHIANAVESAAATQQAINTANAMAVAQATAQANTYGMRQAIIASITQHLTAATLGAPPEAIAHLTAAQQLLVQLQ